MRKGEKIKILIKEISKYRTPSEYLFEIDATNYDKAFDILKNPSKS